MLHGQARSKGLPDPAPGLSFNSEEEIIMPDYFLRIDHFCPVKSLFSAGEWIPILFVFSIGMLSVVDLQPRN